MAKMSIIFDGFKDLAAEIDRSGGNLKEAVDEALLETQDWIQNNVRHAAAPYAGKGLKGYATGAMYKTTIEDGRVEWHGTVAEVSVGFNLDEPGGWHSIFIMYGTPRIKKDQKVYNAIKGKQTLEEIAQLQEEVMRKYLTLGESNG